MMKQYNRWDVTVGLHVMQIKLSLNEAARTGDPSENPR